MRQAPRVIDAHGKHAHAVRFTQNGQQLVSVGQDAKVRFWSVPGFDALDVLEGHTKSVNSISLTPADHLLATSSTDNTTRVWCLGERICRHVLEQQVASSFAPDGRRLATLSRSGEVTIWDAETCAKLCTVSGIDSRLTSLAWTRDGAQVVVGGTGPIHVIDPTSCQVLRRLEGHTIVVSSLLLSPCGGWLASTGAEGTLRLWSTGDWTEVWRVQLRAGGLFQLAWSPDAREVMVSADHLIQSFDATAGALRDRIEVDLKGIYGIAVSPDGRWLANAAADGRLRIWERA